MKHLFTLLALTIGFSMNAQFWFAGTDSDAIQTINNTASGYASTAMGASTTASDFGSLIIGQYNSSGSNPTSADSFSLANTAFVIGNGEYPNLSDAFKVMFNGNTKAVGSVTATSFIGDGSQLSNLPSASIALNNPHYQTQTNVRTTSSSISSRPVLKLLETVSMLFSQ